MMSEFEGLSEVMSVANDNAASVSFEGLVGNLLRAGAVDLARLEGFQYVPYEGLAEEVAKIQEVKVALFEQFWEPSGKVAVRTLAAAATEGSTPDQPSEDNRMSEARRSPSGNDAGGSSGAQV
ncbi:uncharacterized protein LOC120698701 [Panicum virgatum]|uniref:uncharacterized protein LOC120698701 n=1 Tax=Panicum virgatum TaxID=38727 RepID=UPI0019D522E3|nr:uncharacterized protein LOC120698701 [Panicum virgatum]